MANNKDNIDDTTLALLYLTLHDDYRAWKGFAWSVLDRLHEKGDDSRSRRQGEVGGFHPRGTGAAEWLFQEMFEE
jgi:hypothetical protein